MAHFVKPIMSMTPPDPLSLKPKGLRDLHFLGKRFQNLPDEDKYNQVQLMTMSAVDFLDQWFETDALKATMSGFRNHRDLFGRSFSRHCIRAAASLYGRD
jgi:hypothetical protein